MRDLKFSLDVKANALLCPNPTEWFEKSYLQANIVDNFRTVPGVKEATKIAHNTFGNLIQTAGCSWNAIDVELDAEDIDVCKFDVMVEVCQYDLESSFISENMVKGDANWQESEFLSYYWSELQAKVAEELQILRWNGDTTATPATNPLNKCDGYLVKLEDTTNYPGVKELTSFTDPAFDKDNIIDVLTGLVALLPEATISNQNNVRIYMSASNAFAYQLATLGLNYNFNYTGELELKFAGFKIAVQPGMSNDYIVVANKNSLVYAFDGEGDEKNLKIVNMSDTTAEPTMRTRIGMKAGFHILDKGNEVAYAKVGTVTP